MIARMSAIVLLAAGVAWTAAAQSSTLNFLLRRMRHKSDFPALSSAVTRIQRVATSENESLDSLSQEIGRALQYFFTSTPHHKVHYVMLAGGTATLPGLKDRVTDLTGFASMVVNPFDGMKIGSHVKETKVRKESPSYLTACGLAMRRFLQ